MRFLRFSFRQAIQGLWRNRIMNIAATVTMVLMLILLSTLVIIVSGVDAGLSYVESLVEVRAEIHKGSLPDRIADLQVRIEELDEVRGTEFISADEALRRFREERQAQGQPDLTSSLDENPLPPQIAVELADPRESRAVVALLEAESDLVARVVGEQTGIDRLVNLTALVRTIGLGVLTFVGLTVLLIVINTIRMALMSRAQEIEIMRLVGASDRYIRWPFILEGILVGLVGSFVTLLLLLLASRPISDLAQEVAGAVPLPFGSSLTISIVGLVLLAGVGFGGVGAWISVRTYLRH